MCINTETHHAKPNHEYSPLQLEHLDPVHPIRNKSMTHCGIKTDLQFSDPEWYFCSAEWPQLQLREAIAEFQPSCKYTFVRFSESVSLTVWGLIKVSAIVQCSGVFGWSAVLTACCHQLVAIVISQCLLQCSADCFCPLILMLLHSPCKCYWVIESIVSELASSGAGVYFINNLSTKNYE